VERLREVSALRGFTRINAPDELGSSGGAIVRLARQPPQWLPCSEVRGEGIFIRFPEDTLLDCRSPGGNFVTHHRPVGPQTNDEPVPTFSEPRHLARRIATR
jgi:hypothetical protein